MYATWNQLGVSDKQGVYDAIRQESCEQWNHDRDVKVNVRLLRTHVATRGQNHSAANAFITNPTSVYPMANPSSFDFSFTCSALNCCYSNPYPAYIWQDDKPCRARRVWILHGGFRHARTHGCTQAYSGCTMTSIPSISLSSQISRSSRSRPLIDNKSVQHEVNYFYGSFTYEMKVVVAESGTKIGGGPSCPLSMLTENIALELALHSGQTSREFYQPFNNFHDFWRRLFFADEANRHFPLDAPHHRQPFDPYIGNRQGSTTSSTHLMIVNNGSHSLA